MQVCCVLARTPRVLLLGAFVALAFGTCLTGSCPAHAAVTDADSHLLSITRPEALIDSLFDRSQFDSIAAILPQLRAIAEARADSILLGRLLTARGRVELMQSGPRKAELTLDSALAWSRRHHDTLNWMNALGFLGFAVTGQGRMAESMRLYQKRLDLALVTGHVTSEAWARTSMAYVHLELGDYALAQEEYSLAIRLFRQSGARRSELTALTGLGRVYLGLENSDQARACLQKVWLLARELKDRAAEGHAVNNLGALEHDYGDMALAAEYFQRAYVLQREIGHLRGTVPPGSNVALARTYLGQYTEAADILLSARAMCEEQGFGEYLASVLVNLADLRMLQNRPKAAEALYREALGKGEALDSEKRHSAQYGLAQSLAAGGRVGLAIMLLKTAERECRMSGLGRWEAAMDALMARYLRSEGHAEEALVHALNAERLAKASEETRAQATALLELSICYRATGEMDSAYALFERASASFDRIRRTTSGHEWKEAVGQLDMAGLVSAAEIILDHPQSAPRMQRVEAYFNVLQKLKARTLVERITDPRGRRDPVGVLAAAQPVTLLQLQHDVLTHGELLLDFVVAEDSITMFGVTKDSCRLVRLPNREPLGPEGVDLFCQRLGAAPGESTSASDVVPMQQSMADLFLQPMHDLIEQATQIVVVPDAHLSSVPFGALLISLDGANRSVPLLEAREVHEVPSATVLKLLRSRPAGPDSPARGILVLATQERVAGGEQLRGAMAEARYLADHFTGVTIATDLDSPDSLLGRLAQSQIVHIAAHAEANSEKPWHSGIFVGGMLGHTFRGTSGEDESAEVVSPGAVTFLSAEDSLILQRELPGDPYLRARQIAGLRMQAQLAVLAGCESAGGRATSGEGVLGLTSAFLSAGIPAVVATLWPVDDAVTADLMKRFYVGLAEGQSVAAALRKAQLEIRDRSATGHPFYWAGFVVVGDGNAAILLHRSSRPYATWIGWALAAALVVALGMGGANYFRRRADRL